MIHLELGVLEDQLAPGFVAEFELERAWATEAMLAWWRSVLERLGRESDFMAPALNPELAARKPASGSTTISVLLCSRVSLDTLSGCPGALGVHLVSTPDGDPFNDEAHFARHHRVLAVSDRDEFIRLTRELAEDDRDPERWLDEYVEAWLLTVFHEIAHALLFAENAALLPPAEIDLLADAGEIDHDIFDCSTGYGIRAFAIDGIESWAESLEEAEAMMEAHVEERGRAFMQRTLAGDLGARGFLEAAGISAEELLGGHLACTGLLRS